MQAAGNNLAKIIAVFIYVDLRSGFPGAILPLPRARFLVDVAHRTDDEMAALLHQMLIQTEANVWILAVNSRNARRLLHLAVTISNEGRMSGFCPLAVGCAWFFIDVDEGGCNSLLANISSIGNSVHMFCISLTKIGVVPGLFKRLGETVGPKWHAMSEVEKVSHYQPMQ